MGIALFQLARLAEQQGVSMESLGLPTPTGVYDRLVQATLLREELAFDKELLRDEYERGLAVANADQLAAIQAVTSAADDGTGKIFSLDGPGGTGKTFVERLCLAYVRSQGKVALAVASSGVASLLLPNGRTAHSRFKIPVAVTEASVCPISAQSGLADLMLATHLIVWDEAVMQHRHCLSCVDRTLQDLCQDARLFGGVTVLFAGESGVDVRQIAINGVSFA